jgi:hypothetical protein
MSTQQGGVRSRTATDPPRTSGSRLTPSPSPSTPQELKGSTKFTHRIKASTRGLYKPVASLIDTLGVILSLNKLPTTFKSGESIAFVPTASPICIRYLGCLCDDLIGHSAQRSYHLVDDRIAAFSAAPCVAHPRRKRMLPDAAVTRPPDLQRTSKPAETDTIIAGSIGFLRLHRSFEPIASSISHASWPSTRDWSS